MKMNSIYNPSEPLSAMIESASLSELNCAVKNIKGGKKHIIALIGDNYFKELLREGKIHSEDSRLYADIEEKSGNAARMATTVFTSGLGIWMGMADFLANGHRSWNQLLWASGASIVIGVLISFLSYHFAAKRAKDAVLQKTLINLQGMLFDRMLKKAGIKLLKAKEDLHQYLLKLDMKQVASDSVLFFDLNEKEKLSRQGQVILNALRQKIENELHMKTATSAFSRYLFKDVFKQLKKIILSATKNLSVEHPDRSDHKERAKNDPGLLLKFPKHFYNSKMTFTAWLIGSSLSIFLEAVPIVVGTFGAIFLFLNGLPDTLKKLGYDHMTPFLSNIWMKYASLGLATLFVIYLGASQVKFSYKSYLRSKNIDDSRNKVAEKETKYSFLHTQFLLANNFSKTIHKLLTMLNFSQCKKKYE